LRLRSETDERVRTSLILSFGHTAQPQDAPLIEQITPNSDTEKHALEKVIDRFRGLSGNVARIETTEDLAKGVRLELWCRDGLADILAAEASEAGIASVRVHGDRVLITQSTNLDSVMKLRTALYPVLVFQADTDRPETLGKIFAESAEAKAMAHLTAGDLLHYRLTLELSAALSFRKRDWVKQFAGTAKGLANAATGYSWELIVRRSGPKTIIGARPMTPDSRFAYRKADVPASLHPTLAAAAVRFVPIVPTDSILDPFCGSGTLLAERAMRGPYRKLIGVDIEENALNAARRNLEGLAGVSLLKEDSCKLRLVQNVDVIISNPPYGQRVGSPAGARQLHASFDSLASRVLRKDGILVVFRPLHFAPPNEMKIEGVHRVDAGGIPVNLIVARNV